MESVRKHSDLMLKNRDEQSLTEVLIMTDRGYAKRKVQCVSSSIGISSMLVVTGHLLRFHSFVNASFLIFANGGKQEQNLKEE